jgi:hypothetical protein
VHEIPFYPSDNGRTKKGKVKPLNYSQVTAVQDDPDFKKKNNKKPLPFYSISRMLS